MVFKIILWHWSYLDIPNSIKSYFQLETYTPSCICFIACLDDQSALEIQWNDRRCVVCVCVWHAFLYDVCLGLLKLICHRWVSLKWNRRSINYLLLYTITWDWKVKIVEMHINKHNISLRCIIFLYFNRFQYCWSRRMIYISSEFWSIVSVCPKLWKFHILGYNLTN